MAAVESPAASASLNPSTTARTASSSAAASGCCASAGTAKAHSAVEVSARRRLIGCASGREKWLRGSWGLTYRPAVSKPRLAFWSAAIAALERLPQGALSRFAGRLADVSIPHAMRRPVLSAFARAVGADPGEAELPLEEYASLDAFFVRRLRPGARPWRADPSGAGSPVDGIVGQVGRIAEGRLVQAKGIDYTVEDLLADDHLAARLDGGCFLTFYLAPRHYHRIHSPTWGLIAEARHVPGN